MVECQICGKQMNSITWKHLSAHGMTLEQYKQRFPSFPVQSEDSIQRKKQSAVRANASRRGVSRTEEVKQKIKLTKQSQQRSAWNKAQPMSEQQKSRISATRKRMYQDGLITHWNTGNTWSEETKNKIRSTALSQNRSYAKESLDKREQTYQDKRDAGWVHPSTSKFNGTISEQSLEKLNNRDWLYEQHILNQRTISSICVELGMHWKNGNSTVRRKLESFDIEVHHWHQASSIQQREVEDFVKSCGFEIITRCRSIITPYELDIYIPSKNVAIEYCGLYWHTTEYKDNNYHKRKCDMCDARGIRLITLYSDEWLNKRHLVEEKIRSILGCSTHQRVYARKCEIRHVALNDKRAFFNQHHIQSDGPSSFNVGLFYNDALVACMGFIRTKGGDILNRYATSANVVGGFSKLLTWYIANCSPTKIITFADRRWSLGAVYRQTGFELDRVLPADYEYVEDETRVHKFNYRHKYLGSRLEHYDPTKSETENTTLNGIHRIFDCGKLRFVMTFDKHARK